MLLDRVHELEAETNRKEEEIVMLQREVEGRNRQRQLRTTPAKSDLRL
jgi:hypothetical protein